MKRCLIQIKEEKLFKLTGSQSAATCIYGCYTYVETQKSKRFDLKGCHVQLLAAAVFVC